jgi:hypothetical protein
MIRLDDPKAIIVLSLNGISAVMDTLKNVFLSHRGQSWLLLLVMPRF